MSNKTPRRSGFDNQSAEDFLIGKSQTTQARNLRSDGRGKAGNAGEKGTDKRGVSKKTLTLDLETQSRIELIAVAENIPQGDVVMVAMLVLDELHQAGKIDLEQFKELVYSEKQAWRSSTRLVIPAKFIFLGG